MSLKKSYPKVEQWVSYGGTVEIQTVADYKVEVAIGDAGGVPEDCRIIADTVDEALEKAEKLVQRWIIDSQLLLDQLLAGDPKITDLEHIQVPGLPPVENPHYEKGKA